MNKFNCSTCGETHPLITLLEFPQPSVVSEISSGQVERHLNVITKNIYGIDREKIVAKVELNLKIVDYEDELDILIWVEVEGTHLTEKIHELLASKGDNVSLDGKLIQEMPFYRNTLNSPVSLTISRDGFGIYIKTIFKNERLKTDMEEGIKFNDLTHILESLYHYDENNFDGNTN